MSSGRIPPFITMRQELTLRVRAAINDHVRSPYAHEERAFADPVAIPFSEMPRPSGIPRGEQMDVQHRIDVASSVPMPDQTVLRGTASVSLSLPETPKKRPSMSTGPLPNQITLHGTASVSLSLTSLSAPETPKKRPSIVTPERPKKLRRLLAHDGDLSDS